MSFEILSVSILAPSSNGRHRHRVDAFLIIRSIVEYSSLSRKTTCLGGRPSCLVQFALLNCIFADCPAVEI
jgi:hypothetical protein